MAKSSTSTDNCRITVRLPPELIEQLDETVLWMKKTPGIRMMGVKRSHALRYLLERGVLALADHRAGKEKEAEAALVEAEVRAEEHLRARERAEIERLRLQADIARTEEVRGGHRIALPESAPASRGVPGGTAIPSAQRLYREIGNRASGGSSLTAFEEEIVGYLVRNGRRKVATMNVELEIPARRLPASRMYATLGRLQEMGLIGKSFGPRRKRPPYFWFATEAAISRARVDP